MKLQIVDCGLQITRRAPRKQDDSSCPSHRSAFTLLEVMIALGIFFMASFAILALVSNTLRNARALQNVEPDGGMLAAQLSLTNRLYEGVESGDFGDLYPGYTWSREINEVSSNGLFQVDFTIHHRVGRNEVDSHMSTLFYRPESPAGSREGNVAMSNQRQRAELGFTLLEVMIAIAILGLVMAAIYSTWVGIVRASKVGLDAAAAAQRERIAMRVIEDALASAQLFAVNSSYYGFAAESGTTAALEFTARLPKAFPRSGKYGDFDMRHVAFSLEAGPNSGKQLVLRQYPILMEMDADETARPIVLARDVKEFGVEFWDAQLNDWTDDWKTTNQLPKMVKVTLKLTYPNARTTQADKEVTRIIGLPTSGVQQGWQVPTGQGQPGGGPGAAPGTGGPGRQGGQTGSGRDGSGRATGIGGGVGRP